LALHESELDGVGTTGLSSAATHSESSPGFIFSIGQNLLVLEFFPQYLSGFNFKSLMRLVSRDYAPRGAFFARLADGRAPAIRPAGSV
jgi:hypothetical protein